MMGSYSHATRAQYLDWRGNQFPAGRPWRSLGFQCPYFADQFHSACHVAEGGKALAVWVALASEVQLRLIAYADKEGASGSRAHLAARDGNGPVAVPKSRLVRRFVSDGGQKPTFIGQSALHDFDLDRRRVVVRSNSPIECASRVQPP